MSVKLRFADFRTISRSRTMPTPTDVAHDIFHTAWELCESGRDGQKLRLLGVRLEGLLELAGTPHQLALDEPAHHWRDAEVAADAVTQRFGRGAVAPASLVRNRPTRRP